jgi:hypothetical protein
MANKSFSDWFDELCNGNQIWAESVSMHHKPKTFEDCAKRVYDQYLAADPTPFPPMQVARGYVGNVVAKVQPDKTYSKEWSKKAKEEMEKAEAAKQPEWKPAAPEKVDQYVAEIQKIIASSPMMNSTPRIGHKQTIEEGGWLPPKPAPYPTTSIEEAYIRARHLAYIKANYEPRTGAKLPEWISEDEFNIQFDNGIL